MAKYQIEIPQQLLKDIIDMADKSAKRGANNAANEMIREGYLAISRDLLAALATIKEVK